MQVQKLNNGDKTKQNVAFSGELIRLGGTKLDIKGVAQKEMRGFEKSIKEMVTSRTNPSLNVSVRSFKPYEYGVNFDVVEENGRRVFQKQNLSFRFEDSNTSLDQSSGFYYNPDKNLSENVENFWRMLLVKAKGSILPKE